MEIKQKTLLESENGFEQIFEYIRIKILLRTNIWIYSYPKSWHERISEYIRIKKMVRTNILINIWIKNIRIFVYSNIFVTLWLRALLTPDIYQSLRIALGSPIILYFWKSWPMLFSLFLALTPFKYSISKSSTVFSYASSSTLHHRR